MSGDTQPDLPSQFFDAMLVDAAIRATYSCLTPTTAFDVFVDDLKREPQETNP